MFMNNRNLDLRLLRVFDAIMRESSVSMAAKRLGLSQAATSNALNRLRISLEDVLFIRSAEGMAPTPRAKELSGPISEALETISLALQKKTFSPGDASWKFKLAASDQAALVVLPKLLNILSREAPNIQLQIETKWNSTIQAQLDDSVVDIAIGIIPDLSKRFNRRILYEDHYVCIMRKGHPLARGPLSAEDFMSADHLAIRPSLDRISQFEVTLGAWGLSRNVVMNVNQFIAIPPILRETNLVACLLRSVAEHLPQDNLVYQPFPVGGRSVPIVMVWNSVRENNQANLWMRKKLIQACEHLRKAAVAEASPSKLGSAPSSSTRNAE
jgi:DNA-binding transcriptional LysR family regulator